MDQILDRTSDRISDRILDMISGLIWNLQEMTENVSFYQVTLMDQMKLMRIQGGLQNCLFKVAW